MKKLGLFAILFFGLLFLGGNASACGCGMALAPQAVFNSLKESNAFLVADVQEDGSFYLKPYFRFVSLDKEENVKMVFPLKALPKGFDAKKLTQKEFFEREGIDIYEKLKDSQSWNGFAKRFSDNNKPLLFLYAIGFVGPIAVGILSIPILLFGFIGSVGMAGSESLLAHYSFEGGSLDIYNASAEGTLGELVERTGFKPEGKLAELVEKYKNHYVAVLELNVPTALPESQMNRFKNNCAELYEAAKRELKKNEEINLNNLEITSYDLRAIQQDDYPPNSCQSLAVKFVLNAIGKKDAPGYANEGITPPKGVLLELKFAPEDTLFYPVSIVESYNYPVSQQQYFVKTPLGKEFSFTSSYAAQTAIVNETRWMEVKNTNQDIEGIIGNAGLVTQANDTSLRILNALYENAFFVSLLVYLASIFMVWKLLEKSPAEQKPPFWHFLAGGAVLLAYELWKKDEKTAKIMFAGIIVWLILALL